MEMRSGARAAPVWDWRYFLRGSVGFYAQATGIQDGNQIGRGAAKKSESDSVIFGRWPLAFFWSIGLSIDDAPQKLASAALTWKLCIRKECQSPVVCALGTPGADLKLLGVYMWGPGPGPGGTCTQQPAPGLSCSAPSPQQHACGYMRAKPPERRKVRTAVACTCICAWWCWRAVRVPYAHQGAGAGYSPHQPPHLAGSMLGGTLVGWHCRSIRAIFFTGAEHKSQVLA